MLKKAVFCIDNVDPECDVDNVRSFVSSLSVNVLSCFTAEPRRRRNETEGVPILDRKAFRLCIADSDRDRLLDPSKWPDSVVISEWFHKPPSEEGRQRVAARARALTDTTVATSAVPVVTGPSSQQSASNIANAATACCSQEAAVMDQTCGDATILYHNGGSQSTA